jgi:phosphate transport system ATP-binding protein
MSTAIQIENLSFCYDTKQVLFDVSMDIPSHQITALIGPSGCGKSTLLRCVNRINDRIAGAHISGGALKIHGIDVMRPDIDLLQLRRHIGMVFQKYNPFPKSIFENVAYGLRIAGMKDKKVLHDTVEKALTDAALWDEVKDRLHNSAFGLSGGQQQRLCIARAIANEPEILLMDEPCAALDPLATLKIEELLHSLKSQYTIVIVTHNMAQASRCSDQTAFMYLGKLIEFDQTRKIFSNPSEIKTEQYITGSFG